MTLLDAPGFDEVHRLEIGGTVAFVALHAVLKGRSFGGVRIRGYADEAAALADAKALAQAMSRKVVMAGIEGGGGKTVVMERTGWSRTEAMEALGDFVESLRGRYFCGPDYGFTTYDTTVMKQRTKYIACADLAPATARTVLVAMRAVLEPKVVAVQGLGAVGLPVAAMLRESGVKVIASDVRPVKGFDLLAPEKIYGVECDVFAPCAMGGVLDAETLPRLRCRLVCGAANNPFANEAVARKCGIDYVPDFISNSGATIQGASTSISESAKIEARMAAVGPLAREVVERARREKRSSHDIAVEMADRRIAELR